MRTGDRVRIVDGRLYHEGRLDDMVKLGGIWVAPAEIEDVLRGHADVSDAAVVAIDDGSGVPVLKAFVVSERVVPSWRQVLLRLCRGTRRGLQGAAVVRLRRRIAANALRQGPSLPAARPGGKSGPQFLRALSAGDRVLVAFGVGHRLRHAVQPLPPWRATSIGADLHVSADPGTHASDAVQRVDDPHCPSC